MTCVRAPRDRHPDRSATYGLAVTAPCHCERHCCETITVRPNVRHEAARRLWRLMRLHVCTFVCILRDDANRLGRGETPQKPAETCSRLRRRGESVFRYYVYDRGPTL